MKSLTEQTSLEWLRETAATIPHEQAIVEIGVFQGGSLHHLCEGAKHGNNPKVFGVDAWGIPAAYSKPHLQRAYGRANMAVAARNAPTAILIRQLSAKAAQHYTGPNIGLLYIDGEHTYKAASSDFRAWRRHLAPNAWVAFDDYWRDRFDGVIAAVDELVAKGELTEFQHLGHHLAVTRYANP